MRNGGENAKSLMDCSSASKDLSALGMNPRTKRFRDCHLATFRHHIVHNGIIATKDQMANTVIMKYPEDISCNTGDTGRVLLSSSTEWNSMETMADDGIDPADKKVRVVTEINIDDYDRALRTSWANLAEALRPMYRGELILRGNPYIKPYDLVQITDPFENIYGVIEVERVITNFASEVGYTTTIIPHLVAIPQSNPSRADAVAAGWSLGLQGLGAVAAGAGLGILGGAIAGGVGVGAVTLGWGTIPGAIGGGLVGAYYGYSVSRTVIDSYLQDAAGAGIWGCLVGRGRFGRNATPVDVLPLIRNGRPWTAGLRGWGIGGWKYRLNRRFQDLARGIKIAGPSLNQVLTKMRWT